MSILEILRTIKENLMKTEIIIKYDCWNGGYMTMERVVGIVNRD